ncbi:IS200/IS605 family element transposase accessory protein TnpB [Paenibacillus macerans]|uniref:IS200/IS605 family element transposase accessory protein TnpB n=2 Tax=Paenibacillus macerans TaxID=44252 RepID=A0A6N8ETY1_PAEMA|nr:RNA-guided endonuclease TnpB family protein [Paenibacillus macerans]MBS5909211.1 transposase [Paenibacillus macerans]MCY7556884.1 transposase [Paenibacillus macerans]MEC0150065.1 transposase [Paenibacillus macerans]MEC0330008.1 transposase [Paenibacillus macerans]MED4954317.1 transposase [Paenibacillus macerans]
MSTITAKIQIYVPHEHTEMLIKTTKAYRESCNYLSVIVFKTKELNQRTLNDLYYQELRSRFGLKSQMAQSVIKTVIARYKSAQVGGHDWNLVKFKLPEYDLVWNRDYSLNSNMFSLNTLDGRLKLRYEKQGMQHFFDGTWKFGTAKLVYKHKKWFLHIPMTKEFPELDFADVNHIVGIDLGMNFLATTYDSQNKTTFYPGRTVKHKRGQYKALRKQLQMRQSPSARKRLKQIGSRENRYVTDVNHQITKALVETYPKSTLFVIENLNHVRSVTEKVCVRHRYVLVSWAFHQFRQLLEYKAQRNGQRVIALDPKYTSQTCPKCGHIERANRNKKTHTFECRSCHYCSNDDRIGAMNLYRKGIEYIGTVTAGV